MLQGGETLIPGMKMLIDRAADLGVENVVIGMPHRGEHGTRVRCIAGGGLCGHGGRGAMRTWQEGKSISDSAQGRVMRLWGHGG